MTYCDLFYRIPKNRKYKAEERKDMPQGFATKWALYCNGELKRAPLRELPPRDERYGFATIRSPWCRSELKTSPLDSSRQLAKYVYGFPKIKGAWCSGNLKQKVLQGINEEAKKQEKMNVVHYIGIAADEPERVARHIGKPDKVLPLVQIGWDEALCGLEAQYMDMLSPTYSNAFRDGCWFCHNQGVGQLRKLRNDYPELWAKLMEIDYDSPVTFKPDGRTIHDFEKRFEAEDESLIDSKKVFRWSSLDEPMQVNLFGELEGG